MSLTFLTTEGTKSRQLLLRAGLESVAGLGIDKCSVSDVIARAGVSRPTFYSYFDDIPDLMAESWIAGGCDWFDALLWNRLPHDFDATSEHKAFMDLLMATHRNPVLAEVVLPHIEQQWELLKEKPDAFQVKRIWVLATRIGMTISMPVWPEVRNLHNFLEGLELIPDDFTPSSESERTLREIESFVHEPLLTAEDAVTEKLVNAMVGVVASSGVARASMTRVCRAAGVTTGSAKPRFEDLSTLMSRGYEHAIQEVSQQNARESHVVFNGVSPVTAYARLVITSLHPSRQQWRRYRQEMHLASRVSEKLTKDMRKGREGVSKVLSNVLQSADVDERIIGITILINQAQSVGFSLLQELGIPARTINHAVVTELMSVELLATLT
jgi:AcrR family transcriptional regulator